MEDERVEQLLVAVSKLQRTRGLARSGHPVEQHPCPGAVWSQDLVSPGHRADPADEAIGLGREVSHLDASGVKAARLTLGRPERELRGKRPEQRRSGYR